MAAGDAVVLIIYRAECLRCGWPGPERKNSADAHADRRAHDLDHLTRDVTPKKGGGKR